MAADMNASMKRQRSSETPQEVANPHGEKMDEARVVRPTKAYKNTDFMMSHRARPLRFLAEHEETLQRLEMNGVQDFIMFFSSARGRSYPQHAAELEKATKVLESTTATAEEKQKAQGNHDRLKKTEWMCPLFDGVKALSSRLTDWAVTKFPDPKHKRFCICTGGGPGLMEAANGGAFERAPDRSVGMGISLPFEPGLNQYVTEELAFEYHYFFMRKFMMVAHTRALVACPGGMGTCDELFEIMTLVQTGKHPPIPIVLFGKSYWSQVINFQVMADHGVINMADLSDVLITDDHEEAFEHITKGLAKFC